LYSFPIKSELDAAIRAWAQQIESVSIPVAINAALGMDDDRTSANNAGEASLRGRAKNPTRIHMQAANSKRLRQRNYTSRKY